MGSGHSYLQVMPIAAPAPVAPVAPVAPAYLQNQYGLLDGLFMNQPSVQGVPSYQTQGYLQNMYDECANYHAGYLQNQYGLLDGLFQNQAVVDSGHGLVYFQNLYDKEAYLLKKCGPR